MAFTYGFYNSLNHDRVYDAVEMSRIFDGLITDGVYATIGDRLMVNPSGSDNTVIVKNGRAWFNHTWNYNDSDMVLTGPAANVLYNRWDAIVLDIEAAASKRENSIKWIEGNASSNPVKPTMIKEGDHYQYPLAYVYRPSNNDAIVASNIENRIGSEECPYCEGLLSDTKNIAPVEINDTATRAYAYGEYILWHDFLHKVTTPIIQGGTIIPKPETGYNVERTTISTELYNSFVFDTVPTSGSSHAVTSDGIYKALGNNSAIQTTSSVTSGSGSLITSGGIYTALGNRTKITTSAPASGGTNLITNGQVYTALGNRTAIPIKTETIISKANFDLAYSSTLTITPGQTRVIDFFYPSEELYNAIGSHSLIGYTRVAGYTDSSLSNVCVAICSIVQYRSFGVNGMGIKVLAYNDTSANLTINRVQVSNLGYISF